MRYNDHLLELSIICLDEAVNENSLCQCGKISKACDLWCLRLTGADSSSAASLSKHVIVPVCPTDQSSETDC